MKTATLVSTFAAAAGIALASSVLSPAQAATLLGTFTGNDTGNDGTAITNLNERLGPSWSLVGKSDAGFGSFASTSGDHGDKTGTWLTGLTGAGAFAVKASTGYTLWSTNDISSIDWSTVGLVNGGGQQPGLSHLSLFTRTTPPADVPEPLTILGTGLALGFGGAFKKQQDKKKQKDSTKA